MSNKFKNIANVYFDDVKGKIGNAYIYNLSFTQGYSSDASKLTIHAVTEDGDYSTVPSPNFRDIYSIKIDNKIIFRGYVVTKDKQISGSDKTVSVTLVDKSINLDQYAIGLVMRHKEAELVERSIQTTAVSVHPLNPEKQTEKAVVFYRDLADTQSTGTVVDGRVYVIGREKLTSSPCEIPDVEYTQAHFDSAISQFSGDVGISFSSLPTIITGRNYTGTIRTVLNSLCSDQGLSFYYDSAADQIFVFALNGKHIDDSIIETLKNDPNITISSYNESETLEGTFANHVSVREMRPGKEQSKSKACNTNIINSSETEGINKNTGFGNDLLCGMLGKVSGGLRDYYCNSNGLLNRIGVSASKMIENRPNLGSQYETQVDDCGRGETVLVASAAKCIDSSAADLLNSSCEIVRLAARCGIPVEEMIQVFDSNPILYYGYTAELVRMDEQLKDYWVGIESRKVESLMPVYRAMFSPLDIERANGAANSINSSAVTANCQNRNIKQSPEPQWIVKPNGVAGWYFTGGGSVTIDADPLDGAVSELNPTLMNTTANMSQALNFEFENPCSLAYYSHLMLTPTAGSVAASLGTEADKNYEENCVPYMIVYNKKYKKATTGCRGSCNDTTLDEAFGEELCGERELPTGPICELRRVVLEGSLYVGAFGIYNKFYALGPWASNTGFRSNVSIEVSSNKTTGRSNFIKTFSHGTSSTAGFEKLNISDVDATSEIFDPSSQSPHYVKDPAGRKSFNDVYNAVSSSFSSFTAGSSENGLPRSISISIVGLPTEMNKVLDMKSLGSYQMSFGSEGITMNLQYTDAPAKPPTKDFLLSNLHSQFHYTTMGRR